MRWQSWVLVVVAATWLMGQESRADEAADTLKAQKDAAQSQWKKMFGEDILMHQETAHFLIYAPVGFNEKQLKALGVSLEAQLGLARKAVALDPKEDLWTGKMSAWIFDQRNHFTSFIRNVEKRRPRPEDLGTYVISGNVPHIGAGPGTEKWQPSEEVQLGIQLGSAVLARKGGKDLPEWVVSGFGRATAWRASPAVFYAERMKAKKLAAANHAKEAWGDSLKGADAVILQASVMDYLAYGPPAKVLPTFLENLKPEENENTGQKTAKPLGDALKSIKLSPDRLHQGWYAWVASGK